MNSRILSIIALTVLLVGAALQLSVPKEVALKFGPKTCMALHPVGPNGEAGMPSILIIEDVQELETKEKVKVKAYLGVALTPMGGQQVALDAAKFDSIVDSMNPVMLDCETGQPIEKK